MKKRGVVLCTLSVFVLFLVACAPQIPPELYCEQDNDCVWATCCHATTAVNWDHAPDCENVLCTAECQPGTLDCGQGEIKCISNVCTAVIE